MPQKVDITPDDEWFTGTDKTLQFSVVDADGTAVNITGWALEWALYNNKDLRKGASALITRTTGAATISITDGAGGVCQVSVTDDLTDGLAGANTPLYYHELRRTDAGNEDVLAYGAVTIRQSPRA